MNLQQDKTKYLITLKNQLRKTDSPPSYREIGKQFGISSTFGVKRHIDALIKKGFLQSESNSCRTLSLPQNQERMPARENNTVEIPLLGRVAAGEPVFTEENIEDTLTLDQSFVRSRSKCFALKVKGDSMINAGIIEGDFVIVAHQSEARNGEIIVALLGEETTLKRLVRNNNELLLMPENDRYEPIKLNNREDFAIIGVVVGLYRTY